MPTLKQYIDSSGLKVGYLAEQLFLTRSGFWYKAQGRRMWKPKEVERLRELLRIPDEDAEKIFLRVKYTKQNKRR